MGAAERTPDLMNSEQPTLPADARALAKTKPIRRRPRQIVTDLSALPAPRDDRAQGDEEFLPAALEIMETPPLFRQTALAYFLCSAIAAAIAWSIFGMLTTYAVATGQIESVGQSKVIEAVEAGQVSAIRAKDGDRVNQGDALIELNSTAAVAGRTAIADNLTSLRAEAARRRVEMAAGRADPIDVKTAIAWDSAVPQKYREREEGVLSAELSQLAAAIADLQSQRKVKEAARDSATASIVSETSLIAATTERVGMRQQLEAKGWDSRARVLEAMEPLKEQQVALATFQGDLADANASLPVIDSQIAKTREAFVSQNVEKIAAAEREIDDLTQQLTKADQIVTNMTLRAPIGGFVHASAVTTPGQVVKPGALLMQIVPEGAPIEIVAYVLNSDIGFVREGQPAAIKIDTFPYTRYGTIAGTVTKVAADAITGAEAIRQQKNAASPASRGTASDTNAAQQTDDLVFPVVIAPVASTIDVDGKKVALSPGMSVVAEIETGKHSAISYLMYPLVRGAPPSQAP